ncbi:MAG: hypothetical protein U9Q34_01770, partial [Elusimicrobiota bacterium]|nr:hypothetical protein [Elusimicrobiota bacterium]
MSKIKNIFLSLILVGSLSTCLKAAGDVSDFILNSNKDGIMDLSWTYPTTLASDTTIYIQYCTGNEFWDPDSAQFVFQVPSSFASNSGAFLAAVNTGFDGSGESMPIPTLATYFFTVWVEDSDGIS